MIQRIAKNTDIKFCVSDDAKIQDKFIIRFYTVDKSKAIVRTADDVIVENGKRYIKLNWSTLKYLENGILNYEVNNLDSDADYDDGVYNSTFTRTTYYYIYTDSNVIDAVEEIEQKVDQIIIDLTNEKNDREDGDSELTLKINDLIDRINEDGDSELALIINNLSDRLNEEIARAKASEKTNSDNIDNESNNRESADNAITALLNTETSERKKAYSTLTATTTKLDTRLKILENQENQTVWDFGTY